VLAQTIFHGSNKPMSNKPTQSKKKPALSRKDRLAKALRDNLRRRKAPSSKPNEPITKDSK